MRMNWARLRAFSLVALLAAAVPSCADVPTAARQAVGSPANRSITTYFSFGPYYVVSSETNPGDVCYTLVVIDPFNSYDAYRCGAASWDPAVLSNEVVVDPYGDPTDDAEVVIFIQ